IASTPLPLNNQKKKTKNQPAPFPPGAPSPPSHNEFPPTTRKQPFPTHPFWWSNSPQPPSLRA
ncbi:unnamed protein product, partial [Sphagnum compactum]